MIHVIMSFNDEIKDKKSLGIIANRIFGYL